MSTPTDDLRAEIAAALADTNLRDIGDGLAVRPFAAGSPVALAYADAVLARFPADVTEAHCRNLVLRSGHRQEVDDLRAQLVALGAQRDDAEEERTSMVRDLHAAVFDGAISLPDRPLDTVWNYLLGCVRSDPARLSGGNATPKDAAEQISRALVKTDGFHTGRQNRQQTAAVLALVSGWGSAVATPDDEEQTNPSRTELSGTGAQQLQAATEQTIRGVATPDDTPEGARHSVYARMRDGEVDRTRSLGRLEDGINVDLDADGALLGVEILSAAGVEIDGQRAITVTHGGDLFDVTVDPSDLPASPAGDAAPTADTKYLCPTHWAGYLEGHNWWDEACQGCDHVRARRVLGNEAPAHGKRVFIVDRATGQRSVAKGPDGPVRHQFAVTPAPSAGGADTREGAAAVEVVEHRSEFRELPQHPGRWIATCRHGDWVGSGTHDEVEHSADRHYDDALQIRKEG